MHHLATPWNADLLRALDHEILEETEIAALAQAAKAGDLEARNRVIEHTLRFLLSRAMRYSNDPDSIFELLATAVPSVPRAIRKFQPGRAPFVAYLDHWAHRLIVDELRHYDAGIPLSTNAHAELQQIRKARRDLIRSLGRDPADDEIAETTGKTVGRVRELLFAAEAISSLDDAFPDADDESPRYQPQADAPGPDEQLEESEQSDLIGRALSKLPTREARVLRMWFGLGGQRKCTLVEIGAALGVIQERARQIRDNALRRLRQGADAGTLHTLWEDIPGAATPCIADDPVDDVPGALTPAPAEIAPEPQVQPDDPQQLDLFGRAA